MPVISFASPKGGVGKSTAALLLATELAERGGHVSILDGDPNQVMVEWAATGSGIESIDVIGNFTEDDTIDLIEDSAARYPFVIVDLEGSKNIKMSRAVTRSDLVLIPLQPSQIDALRAFDALRMVKAEEKAYRQSIPHFPLFTRTNAAMRTRDEKFIRAQLDENHVDCLKTSLNERAAFRALFAYGGGLRQLPVDQVSNVPAAIDNAAQYTDEVLSILAAHQAVVDGAA
jgi:chromosome partitioning protein